MSHRSSQSIQRAYKARSLWKFFIVWVVTRLDPNPGQHLRQGDHGAGHEECRDEVLHHSRRVAWLNKRNVNASLARVRPYAFGHRDPLAGQLQKVFAELRIVVTEGC